MAFFATFTLFLNLNATINTMFHSHIIPPLENICQ
jgi:hypothetical protein